MKYPAGSSGSTLRRREPVILPLYFNLYILLHSSSCQKSLEIILHTKQLWESVRYFNEPQYILICCRINICVVDFIIGRDISLMTELHLKMLSLQKRKACLFRLQRKWKRKLQWMSLKPRTCGVCCI